MSQHEITAPFLPDEDFPYIFISYAHVDRERVFPIIRRLYEKGWRVWYDEGLELGRDYYKSLRKHIVNCAVFLFFLSENSLKSDFITQNELPLAAEHQKTTVVLDLDGGLGEHYDGEYDFMTDNEGVESILSQIAFLIKTETRTAVGHIVTESLLRRDRDSLYTCEKCRGGVRLTSCSYQGTEPVIPEQYPYLSGLKVVDISKSLFWRHTELISVRLPSTLKSIDLICFLNNRAMERLYIPSNVRLTNALDADLSKLTFTIISSEGSYAQAFARQYAIPFQADHTLQAQDEDTDSVYAYASLACGEATVSFGALMILKERNCRYVIGRMGSPSRKKIENMIKNAACFIAFVNKAYIEGGYLDDLRLALSYGKPVAVWQLEECTLPEDLTHLQDIHQLRYNTGTPEERETKLINWLTKHGCRDPYDIDGYEYHCTDEGVAITAYTGRSVCIAPPPYHGGIPVVSISGAGSQEHIISVRLPETVRIVEYRAFSDCSNLREVWLDEGLRQIGSNAFSGCLRLKTVGLPNSLWHIGSSAFEGCERLEQIGIPEGTVEIGERAFLNCRSLRSITLPEGLRRIGAGAFENCEKLRSITLPASLEGTGLNPFKGCRSLKEIRILGMHTKLFMTRHELDGKTVYCLKDSVMQKIFEKAGIAHRLLPM